MRNTNKTGKDCSNKSKAMVEMIMKRMNQVFRPSQPQKLLRYEVCGGDHPTSQCLPKQNYQAYKPSRTDKWCDFEPKWMNHEAPKCYHRIRHMREQGIA